MPAHTERFHVLPEGAHQRLVTRAFAHRGFTREEARAAAHWAAEATRHGNRTHNALKALHLDTLLGSGTGGCTPGAAIEVLPQRFTAIEVWNAHKKLGQAVAWDAFERCMALAQDCGTGIVCVDNAFHYLWGGGYALRAARCGFVAYTHCTAALAEVVPFGGRTPTLGTNPHTWAFPTQAQLGFPVLIDWATSVIAMGRVQQLAREGRALPADAAVDANGEPTRDPQAVAALLPFGAHKGYGLSLVNELFAALIGGSLPTLRCRPQPDACEKHTPCFYMQVWHPEALSGGAVFAGGRTQAENLGAVLADILGHDNADCLWPGELEARWAERSRRAGGLLFTRAELEAFNALAHTLGEAPWDLDTLPEAAD